MKRFERDSYAQIAQAEYIEELYAIYLNDPNQVETSWRRFFEGMEFGEQTNLQGKVGATSQSLNVYRLIEAYRFEGHKMADINPIEVKVKEKPSTLNPSTYGIRDLSVEVETFGVLEKPKAKIQEILDRLDEVYCQKIGFEYKHIENKELVDFIQKRIENHFKNELSKEDKKQILEYLNKSELFESFIHTKFVGQKRFSLEGLETFIPIVRSIINQGGDHGIEELILCMAHRGRLNVLTNIFERPSRLVFHEFEEGYEPSSFEGSGDVKYHKGYSADIENNHGKRIHISIPPNSSHLESVNSILLGQIRAKQDHKRDEDQTKILGIQVHGDASISGQGVIYETMQMCYLDGYQVGGSLHLILDNQIGFTTLPKSSRSTRYPSDIGKTFGCPVFHVNAEDPNGCILATQLAVEIRQKFKCDVFIHLNGYRKYGHNEGDEPSYTQPLQYQNIRKKKSIREIYAQELIQEGILTEEEHKEREQSFKQELQEALDSTEEFKKGAPDPKDVLGNRWSFWKDSKLKDPKEFFEPVDTRVSIEDLKMIATKMTEIPEGFTPHKKIAQLLAMRRAAVIDDPKNPILDWGIAENLAYGSILCEKMPIRLGGQDARRGTFSHRHAVIVDQKNASDYYPLNHLKEDQGHFYVYDSPLSEYGCLGFEYGYSISTAVGLVIWEAQFGDFANGAQIMIDAYVVNAEEKWNRLSNLTMLLPHGYEGQGPEHSSARVERFLQLAGDNNMVVANLSTPAQLFHMLRRQVLKKYRKPLIIFTPKALLRHKRCTSSVEDLSSGSFQYLIDDPNSDPRPTKLVFCTGRIYYDLLEEKEKRGAKDIAIVRVEQLYPLHKEELKKLIEKYSGFKECIWFQEEPKNMGCWHYIKPLIKEELPDGMELRYIGRVSQASPSTGSHKRHKETLKAIILELFEGKA